MASERIDSSTSEDTNPLFTQTHGEWLCDLKNGVIVKLGSTFNPESPTEYEEFTLKALQTKEGVSQLESTMRSGVKIQIADNWYAWGGAEKDKDSKTIFTLRRMQI